MIGGLSWLEPDWPAPSAVRAAVTERTGGVSEAPYDSLNLAQHVGDEPVRVDENRRLLSASLQLPGAPIWLTQVHGCDVADAGRAPPGCEADAAHARVPGKVCAVLTADCLPLLVTSRSGDEVAAIHAGWRGLAAGVVEAALGRFQAAPSQLLCWLGPAIGPDAFEVGPDVREAFIASDPGADNCFRVARTGHWLADIYGLARRRLSAAGVGFVGGGEYCTVSEPERFFSYRRDGKTGRMASLIWIET